MKLLIKRLLLAVGVLLVAAMLLAALAYRQFRKAPEFYHPYAWDETRRAVVNQQATEKLLSARQMAQRAHYEPILAETAKRAGSTLPATPPRGPLTVQFSEEELNALLIHNSETFRAIKDKYEEYFTEPGVYLKDGRIILAANVKDLGSVLSLHFAPAIDKEGKLRLPLSRALLGRLPVPGALLETQLERVRVALASRLPAWQREARIDAQGGANLDATKVAAGRLLLAALSGRPAEPVLFMPVNDKGTSTPLRITRLAVEQDVLTLTVEPMTPQERGEVFRRMREGR